jgi:signal transduction histidine kinase
LKKYELESLLKSFLLFFLLLGAVYFLVAWGNYRDRSSELDGKILNEMRIFSFHPTGREFQVDFIALEKGKKVFHLYKSSTEIYSLFAIPGSRRYLMKISLPRQQYRQRVDQIRAESFAGWWLYLILIGVVSFFLALYTLFPLKRALDLNEEFVKDILHDINTPLSALRINLNLLKKRYGADRTVERMFSSLETIQAFQGNLKAFLNRECGVKERFDLRELLLNRVDYFRQIYPEIDYEVAIDTPVILECNREAILRILENLLSNAGRYNVPGGRVRILMAGTRLVIEDTGIGIKEPERVFERFYKEGERGLGLGLHIVQKLSEVLGIEIVLSSEVGRGTRFELELSQVILK